jgi:hypothetical protein
MQNGAHIFKEDIIDAQAMEVAQRTLLLLSGVLDSFPLRGGDSNSKPATPETKPSYKRNAFSETLSKRLE